MVNRDDGNLLPCDLVSLGGVLRVCHMEMVLLQAKAPRALVDTAADGEFLFCTAESDFPFRARLTLPPAWALIGYIHHTDGSSWCHGISLASETAFTLLPEGTSEFVFGAGTVISLAVLPFAALQQKIAELDPMHTMMRMRPHPLFQLSDSTVAQHLKHMYQGMRRQLIHGPVSLANLPAAGPPVTMHDLLDGHLRSNLAVSPLDLPNCSRGRRKHYIIVQRAEQFMRSNLRSDIYLHEICNAAEVSERTLRYAFDDLLGISPNRYLSMLRLCTACRSLVASDVSRRSVKSVALSCGLWDLSRFADSYRRIFGELPHDTLTRPQVDERPEESEGLPLHTGLRSISA